MPASSVSSGSSNHSNYPDSESYVLFPNHDDRAPASLSEQLAESLLSPDGQGNPKHDAHSDSGIDTVELGKSMAAAPAMDSLLAVDRQKWMFGCHLSNPQTLEWLPQCSNIPETIFATNLRTPLRHCNPFCRLSSLQEIVPPEEFRSAARIPHRCPY